VIDTHCHLLPALDDGPADVEAAVALARQLAGAGVSMVLCTPHFSRRHPTTQAAARERLIELRGELFDRGVRLKLRLAAEVSPGLVATAPSEELVARSVGEFLLVELEPDTPASFLETALERLAQDGLRPVFAHPERCAAARSQPRLLEEARTDRALVQVVASSLTRRFGSEVEGAAWRLLESGRVDLLASDAHRARPEGLHLEQALSLVSERLGEEALRELTERAPARVVDAEARPV
jgi:protein-tyrosine phosphatase